MNSSNRPGRSPRAPLNATTLPELALRYVGKYATTRAKLRAYLLRKIRERGWDGEVDADVGAIALRFSELGYVDDAAFALGQARALTARGYGKRRLTQKLRQAGVEEGDGEAAATYADAEAAEAALRFAKRRRIGPFADATGTAADPRQRDKWIGSMIRAGHGFAVARALAAMPQGDAIDAEALRDLTRAGDT